MVERGLEQISAAADDASQRLATLLVAKAEAADAALREAIKAALDAGNLVRVRALLDVLDPPKTI